MSDFVRAVLGAALMATMSPHLTNPKQTAEAGEEIYAKDHKERLEREHAGKFAVIDILSRNVYVADTAAEALQQARANAPHGVFHLIRVGAPGAFRVGYTSQHGTLDWFFR